ncbi:MAG: hypothetical protein WKF66_16370 [Pedobacter sp.]
METDFGISLGTAVFMTGMYMITNHQYCMYFTLRWKLAVAKFSKNDQNERLD